MMNSLEFMIDKNLFPVTIPLITAIIVLIIGKCLKSRKIIKNLLGSITIVSLVIVVYFSSSNLIEAQISSILLDFNNEGTFFIIDSLSAVIAILSSILGLVVSLYSIGYLEKERITEYYFLFLLMISALNGVVYSSDLITLFVFTEFLVIVASILVAYNRNKESIEASYKYLIMAAIGAACILFALSYVYILSGTTDLTQLRDTLNDQPLTISYFILILFVFGFGVKAAIFPVHTWLPDAHSAAPSGISAMLSGIVIGAEMYALLKVLTSLFYLDTGLSIFLLIIAALTITIPNLTALVQEDMKRMLAYSSVYNMGLILVGIAIGHPIAIAATVFHIINHGISKAAMFLCAGFFIKEGNTREIKKLFGIGTKMKTTGLIFTIGALYLAGFPPLGMFWSKLYLIQAAIASEQQVGWLGILIAIIIVLNSMISIGYYYGSLVKKITIVPKNEVLKDINETSEKNIPMLASQIILLIFMILISIFSIVIFNLICNYVDSFLSIYG